MSTPDQAPAPTPAPAPAPVSVVDRFLAAQTNAQAISETWRVSDTPSVVTSTTRPAAALLFWHPSVATLAHSLLSYSGTLTECGTGNSVLEVGDVTWRTFPDGWANVRFAERATLEHRNVVFVASMHHPSVVVEQQAFLVALARQRLRSLHVIIPFYGPGTMERVAVEGELATAEPFFKLLTSSMPPLTGGAPTITVFDAHALCTRFYAADTCTVVDASAFSLAMAWARKKNARIVFPDAGAAARFGPSFAGMRTLTCAKKRGAGDERRLTFADEAPAETEPQEWALIVDDLVMSGSTIAECAKLLRPYFKRVAAFCVHAVFPGESWRRFDYCGGDYGVLDNFFVCNTNPSVTDVIAAGLRERYQWARREIFEVWDVAPLLAAQMERDFRAGVTRQRLEHAQLVAETLRVSAPVLFTVMSGTRVKLLAAWQAARVAGYNPWPKKEVPPQVLEAETRVFVCPSMVAERGMNNARDCPCGKMHLTWTARATASGVSEQPLSAAETLRGAEQRLAEHTWNPWSGFFSGDELAIAIESGLWERDGVWQDSAYVVVERRGRFPARATVLSAGHAVPLDDAAHRAAFEGVRLARGAHTLGEALHALDAARYPGAKVWFDRETQLRAAIERALELV